MIDQGNFDAAYRKLNEAYTFDKSDRIRGYGNPDCLIDARILMNLGVIHSFEGEYKNANHFLEVTSDIMKNSSTFYNSWLYNSAICALRRNNHKNSHALATIGLDHAFHMRDLD